MTCRQEVLAAVRRLRGRTGREAFRLVEIVWEAQAATSSYAESTIRTHICSHMCRQAPVNAAVVYDDLDRVERGVYRLSVAPSVAPRERLY
mgnify:FL=1